MSYSIVYDRKFIKVDDKIIPMVLYGSNNCYVQTYRGREKRERSWSPMYYGHNNVIAQTKDAIMDRIKSFCDGKYQEHFVKNGKWVDDEGLLKFFKNGIKSAKTIEELKEEYYNTSLTGYFSVWKGSSCEVENRVFISSSDDLRSYLDDIENRLDSRTDDEDIFFCLEFPCEKLEPRVKKRREPKARLTDYYVICVDDFGWFVKLTSRKMMYSYGSGQSRQFKTEKEANRYIEEKLKDRFNRTFSVRHIVM